METETGRRGPPIDALWQCQHSFSGKPTFYHSSFFFFFKSLKCSKCRQYSRKKESIEIGGVKIVTLVVSAGDKSINIHEHRLPVPWKCNTRWDQSVLCSFGGALVVHSSGDPLHTTFSFLTKTAHLNVLRRNKFLHNRCKKTNLNLSMSTVKPSEKVRLSMTCTEKATSTSKFSDGNKGEK